MYANLSKDRNGLNWGLIIPLAVVGAMVINLITVVL